MYGRIVSSQVESMNGEDVENTVEHDRRRVLSYKEKSGSYGGTAVRIVPVVVRVSRGS